MEDKDQIEASLKWLENPTLMRFYYPPMSPADQLLADGRYLERLIDASMFMKAHAEHLEVLGRISRHGKIAQ